MWYRKYSDVLNEDIVKKDNKLITYIKGDIDLISDYEISPNITLAIDSLYFSSNLDELIASLKNTKLYLYYSQYIFDETVKDRDILNKDNTKIARALKINKIKYHTINYSKNEFSFYETALNILPNYKDALKSEGNEDLYDRKIKEYKIGKQLYEKGLACRYLYIVS